MLTLLHWPATPQLSTLSLHDALPISIAPYSLSNAELSKHILSEQGLAQINPSNTPIVQVQISPTYAYSRDRKSTRLNSSHANISYAVFCLEKKIVAACTLAASYQYDP